MSHQQRHTRRSTNYRDYQSFVLRVGTEDAEAAHGSAKISIRVEHVNVNAIRHFASRVSAFEFISNAIDEFVLHTPR